MSNANVVSPSDEGAVLMPLLCTAKVQEYRDNGWVFEYCDSTRFVGAYHPNGGKQSICELKNNFDNSAFGHAIAKYLNGIGT